jgi:hypothetical protein
MRRKVKTELTEFCFYFFTGKRDVRNPGPTTDFPLLVGLLVKLPGPESLLDVESKSYLE